MDKSFQVLPEVSVLPAHAPIPGMGFLPVNAFLIKAQEPVLVDSGMGMDSDEFVKILESIIDLRDLKWIFLTHDDSDHTGSLQKVLEDAPRARLATNAVTAMRLNTVWPLPMDRMYWLNPGDSINTGDRTLKVIKPPVFDNPTTIGFYDDKLEVLFSADCFGAIVPEPVQNADDIEEKILVEGMIGWASSDSPWLHLVDQNKLRQSLDKVGQIAPKMIFSSHLPPAQGKTKIFLDTITRVPDSTPFVAPDQKALEVMLQQMKPGDL